MRHIARQALSVLLASCLACMTMVTPGAGAYAQDANSGVAGAASSATSTALSSPYALKAEFAGVALTDSGTDVSKEWSSGSSKTASVTLSRDSSVEPDASKKYVLCMECSDVFYFNGLPDAERITGVEGVAIVKNKAPQVCKSDCTQGDLPGFSSYSGEIRLELNTSVETISVSDVGVSFNAALTGYTGGVQTVEGKPLSFRVVAVDSSADLKGFSKGDEEVLQEASASSVQVTTPSQAGSNMKNTLSAKGFVNDAITERNVNVGQGGTIAYAGGTAGQDWQLFSSIKVEFACPYVTLNGKNYYLSFDPDDKALSSNKQGNNGQAYEMSGNAVYDAAEHTITYTFANVYLGGHTRLFYSPLFSWPSDDELSNYSVDDSIEIKGASWKIVEQKSYTGAETTLRGDFTPKWHAVYVKGTPDVAVVSSAEAAPSLKVAKRELYKGLTRGNGTEGTLGFFDVHNDGGGDSPNLNIALSFNTDESSGARYYVTKVNLPGYRGADAEVSYTLTNGSVDVGGAVALKFDEKGNITCSANALRSRSGVGSDYYIKSLSYVTKLQAGTAYHNETAHLYRNRTTDQGLFFGYIEGDVGSTAQATMEVSSAGGEAMTADGKNDILTTEESAISDDDYVAFAPQAVKLGASGSASASITAGDSTTLSFSAVVSTEEYPMGGVGDQSTGVVNGYHVLKDGIFYIALPKGVSIPGVEQVTVKGNGGANAATVDKVEELKGSQFDSNGVTASWWAVEASGVNTTSGKALSVSVKLATDIAMQGVSWSFPYCVAIQAKNQQLSWGAAANLSTLYFTANSMKDNKLASVSALGSALGVDKSLGLDPEKFSVNVYGSGTNATLSIARAEAKLDVETSLQSASGGGAGDSLKISDAASAVEYAVTVSSNDGGYAEDFSYYIPVPTSSSGSDEESFAANCDVPLALQKGVTVSRESSSSQGDSGQTSPFTVSYTEAKGLTSTSVRGTDIVWEETPSDYSKVTAVRVTTSNGAQVQSGDSYRFVLELACADGQEVLESKAGCTSQWRSFGRYSYVRNGVATTNTYPSATNTITAWCARDLTGNPTEARLDTGSSSNEVDVSATFDRSFVENQTLRVKSVSPSSGTELVASDPSKLTGSDANGNFELHFNINNSGNAIQVSSGMSGGSWDVSAKSEVRFQAKVRFSKALTDSATERYVDFVIGNDCVDVTWRVKLVRTVAAVEAAGSGVTSGSNYQVPTVGDSCSIARDSAFTALFVAEGYTPGNYSKQSVGLKNANGTAAVEFPAGTAVTMMTLDADSKVNGYWIYMATGNETAVDLGSFVRMAGGERLAYDTSSASQMTLRYLLVVDFSGVDADARLEASTYRIVFEADPKEGVEGSVDIEETVTLCDAASFSVRPESSSGLEASITRTVALSAGDESYLTGKSLAFVVAPTASCDPLPADARLRVGETQYARNSAGSFIIPAGALSTSSASIDLEFVSDMFPDAARSYSFKVELVLSNSMFAVSPLNGEVVASCDLALSKAESKRPAIGVSGARVAKRTEWASGQDLALTMDNIPADARVSVRAYAGLGGTQQVTDLLSSVCGVFNIDDGVGVYDSSKASTGKLVLNGSVQQGTYRLEFEVTDPDGTQILTVPYYLVVR